MLGCEDNKKNGMGRVKKNYSIYINSLKFNFYCAHWKETGDSVGIVGAAG